MRRWIGWLATAAVTLSLVPAPVHAAGVSAQEWAWMEAASAKVDAGDTVGAMAYWSRLISSLRSHNPEACANYAQKLGRALDSEGRYDEAIQAFESEFACRDAMGDTSAWTLWDRRRVEQIRPEIKTFVSRPTAGETPGYKLAKHEPAFGVMLGGTTDFDTAVGYDISKVAATYGKGYGMVLVYAHWNEPLPVVATNNGKKTGAALQVGWEPTAGLAAVKDDAYIRGFARSLKAYGGPVFLRFASEMNGAWTAWHETPELYREKWALVTRIMREEAPNVAMVWSPNYVGEADTPEDLYYPGDEYVDWVGINAYTEAFFSPDPSSQRNTDVFYQGKRSNPLDKFRAIYDRYSARKPIMISETGFGWARRKGGYVDETPWAVEALTRFYGYLPMVFPRLKAVAYFNVDFNRYPGVPSTSHYLISGNPQVKAAYRAMTASDSYLSSPTAVAGHLWRPVEQATLAGPAHVGSYVNLGGGVSKVEYLLDGEVKATATALPWEADLDFSGLTGSHTLTVRAYDKQGRLGYTKEYSIDGMAIKVKLNGRHLDFDQPPVNLEGRVMVPARMILEALGAEITWEGSTRTVVAKKDGTVLRLQIDNPIPLKDGLPLKALDVPARILNGRTLVPARFVSENFHMDVSWDGATRTVMIQPKP